MEKSRKMPIGTVSRGYTKMAEGKWVKIKQPTQVKAESESETSESKQSDAAPKKKTDGGYSEISHAMGFNGGKIDWKSVTKQQASKALNSSHGMSKAYYDRLRGIESGGKSLKAKKKLRKSSMALCIWVKK